MFHFIISFVLAYLFGSIPSGYWIGKIFYKKNILELGSGNIGTTNTFRTLGTIPGVVVLILDLCKGILGASMATIWESAPHWMFMVVGLGAILGHTFSIWIGFKGGKAVATSVGVLLLYSPVMFLAAVIAFITAILLTSMVSVGSMLGFTVVTLLSAFWLHDWFLATIALVLTVFVFYRHRSNVKRILNGTESKVPFGLIYWLSKKS
ncbi:glycerol-3-phosphate 1-O-acyltransferase PlsY [Weissella paramesenteroides]|nr:glycerol-3-phosphate 1-O-acyltransferase PlsY [Weissella paramesenteroides]KAA8441881.1 glycerol-3-phosphate 1-O-acyltransferase PlsY [Weissella paramesenteroides]KAA8443487.1 glycerol-3-phosphate 1-O-acyltransferase PlsY [Weissella paramesenteroides]KAA8447775.1 glycerol-3-phosphate 1-O-acyltransferase PlsY [Weissella paramesenteroides]KAA8449868.1 glycerol-3-phosphate 1-O-acyltransferase PlsY [Weissella paramesenteroides]